MDEAATLAPIRRTITVTCGVERAFRVFTEEIAGWWPLETHSVTASRGAARPAASVVVEGRVGGRVYEVMANGDQARWAEVMAWDPPRRLVLAWMPNPDRSGPTEVEVLFEEVEDGRTRVELEHRGWERLGSEGGEVREGYAVDSGWTSVLARFEGALGT